MATINLGRIKPLYQGSWDSGTVYEPLDFVKYNGLSYFCIQETTAGIDPTNELYWQKVVDAASAAAIGYNNTISGLTAEDIQTAIDEVDGNVDQLEIDVANAATAVGTSFDNSGTSFTATDVQNTLEEVSSKFADVNTEFDTVDTRVTDLETVVYTAEVASVSWNMETDTWTGDPKATSAHTALRRCVIDNTGTVQYYLDEYDSTLKEDGTTPANLDGTDGDVVVEMLPFYVRTTFNGHVATWEVSSEQLPGFSLHPAFSDGVTKSYIGAYDAVVYDTSTSSYIDGLNLDNNTSRVNVADGLLASVASGNYPMVGLTRSEFRGLAENAGYQLFDFWQWQALMLLFITEYGSWNSQAILGRGNVDRTYPASSSNQGDSPHEAPGLSNTIGNGSGGIDDADGDPWVSYRGVENLWGNCWTWLDGWNIQDRQSYVANDETVYEDDVSTGYTSLGAAMPTASDSPIKNWQYIEDAFLVRTVSDGASTSAYVTDHFWTNTGWRVALVGGDTGDGLRAGLACCTLNDDSADRYRTVGARLSKKVRA